LSPEEIILDVVKDYDYPVCFGFPTGHIDDNRAMVLGAEMELTVAKHKVFFRYT
jgi:muramoyltetrapeptide carboxypeptidase